MAQSPFNNSTAMSLPVPVVGLAPGPDYATYINNCLSILDQHTHSAGSGNPITPDGMNITGVLSFNGNDASTLRSIRYQPQASTFSTSTDVGCTYVVGADLYYRDTVGNNVRITQSGGVAGSPGSIANLTSPASATYVPGSQTFVWQSGANLPANLDAGAVIVRNLSVNSNGITIVPPTSLGSNYTLTLPTAPPGSQQIVSMNSAGQLAATDVTDESTLTFSSGIMSVKNAGITSTQIASGAVGTTQIASGAVGNSQIAALTIDGNAKIVDFSIPQWKMNLNGPRSTSFGGGSIAASSFSNILSFPMVLVPIGRSLIISITQVGTNQFFTAGNANCSFRITATTTGGTAYVSVPANQTVSPTWTVILPGSNNTATETYSETINVDINTGPYSVNLPYMLLNVAVV